VANVGLTAHNIDNLGMKAFLKTAGKKTAKALFRGHNEHPTGDGGDGGEEKEMLTGEQNAQAEEKEVQKKVEEEEKNNFQKPQML